MAKFSPERAIRASGVSKYQLAKKLKISYPNFFRLCRAKNPTLKTMNRLAKHLGCKVRDLLDE